MWGSNVGGCFAYSHALGGFAGSHAEYFRVPYADIGRSPCRTTSPTSVPCSSPTRPPLDGPGRSVRDSTRRHGCRVGSRRCRADGRRAAMLLGAEQVIVIDRLEERLAQVRQHIGAETLDYASEAVTAELKERTGGRGPDAASNVSAWNNGTGVQYLYDQVKQQMRLQTDRPTALREAIYACRKGGSVFALGAFGGMIDKFPMGAVMNKSLHTARCAAAWSPVHPHDSRADPAQRDQYRAPGDSRHAAHRRPQGLHHVQEQGRRLRARSLRPGASGVAA